MDLLPPEARDWLALCVVAGFVGLALWMLRGKP